MAVPGTANMFKTVSPCASVLSRLKRHVCYDFAADGLWLDAVS
jgi:hypothetical protein